MCPVFLCQSSLCGVYAIALNLVFAMILQQDTAPLKRVDIPDDRETDDCQGSTQPPTDYR